MNPAQKVEYMMRGKVFTATVADADDDVKTVMQTYWAKPPSRYPNRYADAVKAGVPVENLGKPPAQVRAKQKNPHFVLNSKTSGNEGVREHWFMNAGEVVFVPEIPPRRSPTRYSLISIPTFEPDQTRSSKSKAIASSNTPGAAPAGPASAVKSSKTKTDKRSVFGMDIPHNFPVGGYVAWDGFDGSSGFYDVTVNEAVEGSATGQNFGEIARTQFFQRKIFQEELKLDRFDAPTELEMLTAEQRTNQKVDDILKRAVQEMATSSAGTSGRVIAQRGKQSKKSSGNEKEKEKKEDKEKEKEKQKEKEKEESSMKRNLRRRAPAEDEPPQIQEEDVKPNLDDLNEAMNNGNGPPAKKKVYCTGNNLNLIDIVSEVT